MPRRYVVVIVDGRGREFRPESAPTFHGLEQACDEAAHVALLLSLAGDRAARVIVRDRLTGEVESVAGAF